MSGIRNINISLISFLNNFVNNYKMSLVPVNNTRQRQFSKFFKIQSYSKSMKSDFFGSLTYSHHTDPLMCNITKLSEFLDAYVSSVKLSNHTQTSWSAIHRIKLLKKREGSHQY